MPVAKKAKIVPDIVITPTRSSTLPAGVKETVVPPDVDRQNVTDKRIAKLLGYGELARRALEAKNDDRVSFFPTNNPDYGT